VEPLKHILGLSPRGPSLLRSGRRAFLGGLFWVSLFSRRPKAAFAQSAIANPLSPALQVALEAVVDTIVPRDQDPGALDAGVPARIIAHLSTHPEALTLYRAGLGVLEGLARQAGASSFHALGGPEREQILSSLAGGPDGPRGVGAEFLVRARRDVLAFYWGSEVGQHVVGYPPPLSGYPDYADPPSGARSPQQ